MRGSQRADLQSSAKARPRLHLYTESSEFTLTQTSPRGIHTVGSYSAKNSPRSNLSSLAHSHQFSRANLHPILHIPRRFRLIDALAKTPRLALSRQREQISARLLATNAERRALTERLLQQESTRQDPSGEKRKDDFLEKYSEKEHIYRHELIGTVHLPIVPARVLGALNHRRIIRVNEELEEIHRQMVPKQSVLQLDKKQAVQAERPWKAFSAIKHLIQLHVPLYLIPKLNLLVPQRPYQLPNSFEFLMACRAGDLSAVSSLLTANRWVALAFDHGKQTGLHWAAKRGHGHIMTALLEAGTYIDARDYAGRTALFVAARKGHMNEVVILLSNKANPFLMSAAGKSPQNVAASLGVQKKIEKSMLLNILLKFVPSSSRSDVWEREGINYFRADSNG